MDRQQESCPGPSSPYVPSAEEVEDLLRRAAARPSGTGLLRDGPQDAVAAAFGVHAFVVDAARERLRARERVGS